MQTQGPQTRPELVNLLAPGTGLDLASLREQIGGYIAGMPCQETLLIKSESQIAPDVDTSVPGVKDKRRIQRLSVEGCLEQRPKECHWNLTAMGATDFGYKDLHNFFERCRDEMRKAVKEGQPLTKEARMEREQK